MIGMDRRIRATNQVDGTVALLLRDLLVGGEPGGGKSVSARLRAVQDALAAGDPAVRPADVDRSGE